MPPFSLPIFVTCPVSIAFQEQETGDAVQVLCGPAYQSMIAVGTSVSWELLTGVSYRLFFISCSFEF